jgi:threonine dehydrogenase-like Zn-dependent dehydrogenase
VIEGPGGLRDRVVFCLYPHQTRYVIASSAVFALPDGVAPSRAVLAGNLETAINGMWDADVRVGDRVAVVGAGVVGALVAYLAARVVGCQVELIDVLPERARVATALGVAFASPESARREADVVVNASGAPEGLATALALAGNESTIVEMSWYGDRATAIALGGAFHSRRLTLRSSQVGGVPAPQRARWTPRRRLELALSLLVDPTLDALVDGESDFEELPAVMHGVTTGAVTGLCHRLRYAPEKCTASASVST